MMMGPGKLSITRYNADIWILSLYDFDFLFFMLRLGEAGLYGCLTENYLNATDNFLKQWHKMRLSVP